MPSDKRARQRAAREARLAAEARARKRRGQLRTGGIVAVVAAVVIGIVFLVSGNSPKPVAGQSGNHSTTSTTLVKEASNATLQSQANALAVKAGCPASPTAAVNAQKYTSAPPLTINTNDLYSATIVTTAGTIDMSLFAKAAPNTVNNFVFLADKGWFKCDAIFRVIPGFVDQTGSNDPPNGTPGYKFANENVPTAYATGDVAMANGGPGTNSSEFFFVAPGGATQLNADLASGGYSLFGSITSGQSVVNTINGEGTAAGTPNVTQRILSVTIHQAAGL